MSLHFLDLDPDTVRDPQAPYAVLPVPYERTVSYGAGTARAPAAILAASVQIELVDEELLQAPELRVQTLPALDCQAGSERQILDRIEAVAYPVMHAGRFLMTLGGEHTITLPLAAAARRVYGSALCALHLDAHLDLRDTYRANSLSHACVMRRVTELGLPVVPVGIRSVCAEEHRFLQERRQPVWWARDICRATDDAWIDAIIAQLNRLVYITIDSDALDPAVMPGTGTPEPGGLSWYAMTDLLRRVCAARTVVAADLVEVVPLPGTPVCEYTAARLATKLMTYHRLISRPPGAP